jgi:excisionase family DNA binding protein
MALNLELPAELIEAIAVRAAQLVAETRHEGRDHFTESPYMTIPEAAVFLRCTRQRIDDLLSSRRLTRIKEGRRTLIARAEIESYVTPTAR